jgi:malonyl-CoA O-methyltransferase
MASMIDRRLVRTSFSRRAAEYEALVVVQRRVQKRLLAELAGLALEPQLVVDVGAGTGMLLRQLAERYPAARLVAVDLAPGMCQTACQGGTVRLAVAGDAESLPLHARTADLVLSSSTFQWLPTLAPAFSEARRVLQPGGWFCFALFGEGTLRELRESYRWAIQQSGRGLDRTHTFHTSTAVATALADAGFSSCKVWSEQEEEFYPDVPDLLRAVRGIGAGNASPRQGGSLAERRVMLTMMSRYRQIYGRDGGIPASYDVLYGVARCP